MTATAGPWANQSPITSVGYTISKAGIANFSIWTLGNSAAPLPVEMTAFTATRNGPNAALAWATAGEKNSRGFEVQVSTDGRSYRVLGFVASSMAASMMPRKYAQLDREAGKVGLRQVDLDGTASFSSVRTPRFEEAATALGVSAVPNPFRDRLARTISLPAGLAGASDLLSLTDTAGRVVSAQRLAILPAGASEVAMPDAAKLSSGVYFVRLVLSGQPIQHLKVVKE